MKSGPSVTGTFISASNHDLTIQPENSPRKTIKLDAVASIVFLDREPSGQRSGAKSSKEQEAAEIALKGLRGIAAATEVGISVREYGSRVIDAKILVEDALRRISDGGLKSEIGAALNDYEYAVTAWDTLNVYNPDSLPLGSLFPPDNAEVEHILKQYPGVTPILLDGKTYYRKNSLLSGIWSAADKHIDRAAKILGH